jgi:hypothetical protein
VELQTGQERIALIVSNMPMITSIA